MFSRLHGEVRRLFAGCRLRLNLIILLHASAFDKRVDAPPDYRLRMLPLEDGSNVRPILNG